MVGKKVQQYQFLEKLGEGGMGQIYRAQDTRLNRFVAIKCLTAAKSGNVERRRRFVQEAQAASALNHPNIITIHDILSEDDADFMVMEYVPGRTLVDAIPKGGLRVPQVIKMGIQIADALRTAHGAGIVHRDLKPANFMLTDSGLVKVLDFGLAKLTDSGPLGVADTGGDLTQTINDAPLTVEGSIIGTVSYMSPEQAQGQKVDARSDIFSFGVVLYEMLTGERAFRGASAVSTLTAILRDDVKPITEMVPDVSPELEQLVKRCLRKDPAARFQSMDEIHAILSALRHHSESGMMHRDELAQALSGISTPAEPKKVEPRKSVGPPPIPPKLPEPPKLLVQAALSQQMPAAPPAQENKKTSAFAALKERFAPKKKQEIEPEEAKPQAQPAAPATPAGQAKSASAPQPDPKPLEKAKSIEPEKSQEKAADASKPAAAGKPWVAKPEAAKSDPVTSNLAKPDAAQTPLSASAPPPVGGAVSNKISAAKPSSGKLPAGKPPASQPASLLESTPKPEPKAPKSKAAQAAPSSPPGTIYGIPQKAVLAAAAAFAVVLLGGIVFLSGDPDLAEPVDVAEEDAAALANDAATQALAGLVLTNELVAEMVAAGIPEEIILSQIRSSQSQFDFGQDLEAKLTEAGVPAFVIAAMRNPGMIPAGPLTAEEAAALAGNFEQQQAEEAAAKAKAKGPAQQAKAPPKAGPKAAPPKPAEDDAALAAARAKAKQVAAQVALTIARSRATNPELEVEEIEAPQEVGLRTPVAPAAVVRTREVILPAGSPVPVRLTADIPQDAAAGTPVRLTVGVDFRVDGVVLLPAGTQVTGEISQAARGGFLFGGDSMMLTVSATTAVDGTRVTLRAVPAGGSTDQRRVRTGNPAPPDGVEASAGTEYIAYVDSDAEITVPVE